MPDIFTRIIHEIFVEGKRLGRHVVHDPRSRDYPCHKAASIVSVKHAAWGLPLNQGSIGSCTANALCGAENSAPNGNGTKVYTETDAVTLYSKETADEGSPYPPNDPGGSGLAVCQAAKELGWIQSYTHAFSAQDALEALVLRPIIIGIDWYTSFDTPDPKTGVVEIAKGATVRGGHEILCDEIDAPNSLVGIWNSWGTSWGLGGKLYMTFDTFDQLLQSDGDATVPGDTPS